MTDQVTVDAQAITGPLEIWRHSVGHGGINPQPLPDRVVEGMAKLQPRLVRVFIQEFSCIMIEEVTVVYILTIRCSTGDILGQASGK